MDPNIFLVALIVIVLFASISIVGSLHRIRNATEEAVRILRGNATDV